MVVTAIFMIMAAGIRQMSYSWLECADCSDLELFRDHIMRILFVSYCLIISADISCNRMNE